MPSVSQDLKEVLKTALAAGAYGLTVRTGQSAIVHHAKGRMPVDGVCPTDEDVSSFLRQLTSSREMRQFRLQGLVHFTFTFEGRVRLLGGARQANDQIRVELRRMIA